jgi:hypothetical protein
MPTSPLPAQMINTKQLSPRRMALKIQRRSTLPLLNHFRLHTTSHFIDFPSPRTAIGIHWRA